MLSSAPSSTSTTPNTSSSSTAGQGAGLNLASNFNEFLTLLTTQLEHQDPTSPLDPNQFTQELVQFASVEQQINTNTSLNTLISLQQMQQASSALQFVGATVALSGKTAQLTNGQASWSYSVNQPATATINVTNSSGQVVYTTTQAAQAGSQTFSWNGLNSQGISQPSGSYTISISAVSANNQNVPVTIGTQGVVTGVDISQSPPNVTVGGQSYPINQITQVLSSGTNNSVTQAVNNVGTSVQNAITQAFKAVGL
ncbi:MAG TPA: flagellar hook capping FlgD N-terminal domain-containing protein [Xanthobacteraceae bacterium]|jgi:flagellar basal-body rod modification protein FlgD|nr:flagellar hook capping FlgD N-terminal domain-containing protein [Xanthobacteraceae bacterium]